MHLLWTYWKISWLWHHLASLQNIPKFCFPTRAPTIRSMMVNLKLRPPAVDLRIVSKKSRHWPGGFLLRRQLQSLRPLPWGRSPSPWSRPWSRPARGEPRHSLLPDIEIVRKVRAGVDRVSLKCEAKSPQERGVTFLSSRSSLVFWKAKRIGKPSQHVHDADLGDENGLMTCFSSTWWTSVAQQASSMTWWLINCMLSDQWINPIDINMDWSGHSI